MNRKVINKKGFTLVELLATIVILGLIMTIVATKGFGAFDKSKQTITNLNENMIKESINLLSIEIEQCDDETNDAEELSEVLGVKYNTCSSEIGEGCECLKSQLSDQSISISLNTLKDKGYINGSDIDTTKYKDAKVVAEYIQNEDDTNKKLNYVEIEYNNYNLDDPTLLSNTIKNNVEAENKVGSENLQPEVLTTTEDDYGTSYYFRGNVENNYLNFAGMCWRIVRIEGDGSIKLILASRNGTCETANALSENSALLEDSEMYGMQEEPLINIINNDKDLSEYYSSVKNSITIDEKATIKLANYLNSKNNKGMKEKLNDFLTKFSTENKNKLKDDVWCIGDQITKYKTDSDSMSYENVTNNISKTGEKLTPIELLYQANQLDTFFYDSEVKVRLLKDKRASMKCQGQTSNDYPKSFKSKIGTLTADEVAFIRMESYNSYLNANTNSNESFGWWLLSIYRYNCPFTYNNQGSFGCDSSEQTQNKIRPAITLVSSTKIKNGNGTVDKPYEIK